MGIDSTQPSLFDHIPTQPGGVEPVLSPSEKFRLDNPDFVEPVRVEREWDPNQRREQQLRESGAGGGIADAIGGTILPEDVIVTPVSVTLSVPVSVSPRQHSDSKRPISRATKAKAWRGMTDEEIDSQNALNKREAQRIINQLSHPRVEKDNS